MVVLIGGKLMLVLEVRLLDDVNRLEQRRGVCSWSASAWPTAAVGM